MQILAGTAWAAYELAMFLMFFDHIRPEERTAVLTIFNVGHAATTVAGSLVGGALLLILGRNVPAYMAIFAVSSLARLATLPWLARVPAKTEFDAVPALDGDLEGDDILPAVTLASRSLPTNPLAIEAANERAA